MGTPINCRAPKTLNTLKVPTKDQLKKSFIGKSTAYSIDKTVTKSERKTPNAFIEENDSTLSF